MKKIYITFLVTFICTNLYAAGDATKPLKVDWSFNGFFGTFDRAQLQRGFQVYKEVCASCHSMKHLSYRNLGEKGGPEFSDAEVKAIAAGYQVKDGPNEDGEMFDRAGLPKDKFKSPYPNEKAARAVNGGAYPPDMSVLVKARAGGPNYIYSILLGYDENPPVDLKIEEGVYYNKFMAGKKIRMAKPLNDGSVEYSDGTKATVSQMSQDVTAFMTWAAEPHLEKRKRIGFKTILYLLIFSILVFFSMKKIWSRVESKV
jgi:ubiquinol-cytochrome c reductase cytochrome c1 subunit